MASADTANCASLRGIANRHSLSVLPIDDSGLAMSMALSSGDDVHLRRTCHWAGGQRA